MNTNLVRPNRSFMSKFVPFSYVAEKSNVFFQWKGLLPCKKGLDLLSIAKVCCSPMWGTYHRQHSMHMSISYTHYSFTSGSSIVKHRRRRYSFNQGDWMWWYRPCLSCSFSHLAKGYTSDNTQNTFYIIFLHLHCISVVVKTFYVHIIYVNVAGFSQKSKLNVKQT